MIKLYRNLVSFMPLAALTLMTLGHLPLVADAQSQNPSGQLQLSQQEIDQDLKRGRSMLYGSGSPEEQNDVFNAMLFLSSKNTAEAQYILSNFYRRGIRGYLDKDKARAFYWMKESAINGHGPAQLTMGEYHRDGIHVEKNPALAVGWYKKGIENSPSGWGTHAAFFTGMAYFYGMGDVPVDDKKAMYYLDKANGHPPAEFLLGLLYEAGRGVKQDYEKAALHYQQTIDNPYDISGRDSDLKYRGGSIKSAAEFRLAYLYKDGRGVNKTPEKFVKLIQNAAKGGVIDAQRDLGTLYRNGFGLLTKNSSEAVRYYKMAAEKEDSKAAYFLGDMYLHGRDITADSRQALQYLEQSANSPYGLAQIYLGDIYSTGEGGVRQNLNLALSWYKRAAETGHPSANGKIAETQEKLTAKRRTPPAKPRTYTPPPTSRYSSNELSAGEVFTGLAIIAGLVVAHNALNNEKNSTSAATDTSTPIGVSNCVQNVRSGFYKCEATADLSSCTMVGCPDYWECGAYSLQSKNGKDKVRFRKQARKYGKCFRPSNSSASSFSPDVYCDPNTGKTSDNIYRLINKVCTP